MVQAAAAGAIDFDTADILSRHWWLKLRWTLDRLEDTNSIDVYALQHAHHASVLDYDMPKEAFDKHWTSANDIIKSIHALQFPWAESVQKNKNQQKTAEMFDKWREKFGDIKDPKVKEHYDTIAAKIKDALEKRRNQPKPESQNDKLKKVLERRKKKAQKRR